MKWKRRKKIAIQVLAPHYQTAKSRKCHVIMQPKCQYFIFFFVASTFIHLFVILVIRCEKNNYCCCRINFDEIQKIKKERSRIFPFFPKSQKIDKRKKKKRKEKNIEFRKYFT